jgi:hypothetical protein
VEADNQQPISKEQLEQRINNKLNMTYFDVQGINFSKATENHVARLITKVVVGAVTIWWSFLELRSIYNAKRTTKGQS